MHIFYSETEFTQTSVHEDNNQGGGNTDQSQEEVHIHNNQDGESDSEEVPDIINVEEALFVARGQTSTDNIEIQVQSFLSTTCGCQLNGVHLFYLLQLRTTENILVGSQ